MHQARLWLLAVVLGAGGCSGKEAGMPIDAAHPASVSVEVEPVDVPVRVDRIMPVNLDQGLRTDETLRFFGAIRQVENDPEFIGVALVHFYTMGPANKRSIVQSAAASLYSTADGQLAYDIHMEAPRDPGTYAVEVSIGNPSNVIARGKVRVE